MSPPLLILDLDETIICGRKTPLDRPPDLSNRLSIRPYTGPLEDAELPLLAQYLDRLAPLPKSRAIEKHDWLGSCPL